MGIAVIPPSRNLPSIANIALAIYALVLAFIGGALYQKKSA